MAGKLSKAARQALQAVTGRRARIVVEHIQKFGSITTDDLKRKYGYDHPPRAIKDVSDQGIPLVKTFVRKKNGKRMAEYRFGNLDNITKGRFGGRANLPKALKQSLVTQHGNRCGLCNTALQPRYLQIDHRVPYLVAGERAAVPSDVSGFMLVCSSCNRAKSWSCEHCPNAAVGRDTAVCSTCYWASPLSYAHVATEDIRRLDLTWTGSEVGDFDAAKTKAGTEAGSMPRFVKDAVRRAVRGGNGGSTAPDT